MCGRNSNSPALVRRADKEESESTVWFKDLTVLVPIFSGLALFIGLLSQWLGADLAAQFGYWTSLILGLATFAPEAAQGLFTRGKLGISLLMTISAIGAILLGYIQEAAALAFLYSIAEALESKAMQRARSGLRALLQLVPETVLVRCDGEDIKVDATDLQVGDVMIVRPGERIATDGVVCAGRSSLDTSAITGESIPVEVGIGSEVSAGSINATAVLEIEASAEGTDNSLTTIVELVEQAQVDQGKQARLADRIARPLVPGVLVLAVAVGVIGSLLGDTELWITRALVVLVAASPCALAISVPLTVVAAIGRASRFGMLIKSGAAFEQFGTIRHIAVDKTGTLTEGKPQVHSVHTVSGVSDEQVVNWAGALERYSTHPLAAAITDAASTEQAAEAVEETTGLGITGRIDGEAITVGSPRWLDAGELTGKLAELENQGMTVVIVAREDQTVGIIGVRDELRAEVAEVVDKLREHAIGITMLTGDNHRTAQALAAQAGIDDVHADLTPEIKATHVGKIARTRPVAMIGDGINDAPALAAANVGIAMGEHGSDAAIESADIAFTGTDLRLIPQAVDHARRARAIMNQNLVLSILIIVALLPMALFGVLSLAWVVLAHELVEVIVILNGLRASRIAS